MTSLANRISLHSPRRLRRLLTLTMAAVIAIPVLVLVVVPPMIAVSTERARAAQALEAQATSGVALVKDWYEDAAREMDGLATGTFIQPVLADLLAPDADDMTVAMSRAVLTGEAQDMGEYFDRVLLVDPAGVVRGGSASGLIGEDFSGEAWFREALASASPDQLVVVGPLSDPVDGTNSLYMARQVVGEGGVVSGVVVGRSSTALLATVLAEQPLWGDSADYYVVGPGQKYLVPPRFADGLTLASDPVDAQVAAGNAGVRTWRDYRGVDVLGAYRPIVPLGVGLVVKLDADEALVGNRGVVRNQLILGLVTAAAAAVVGVVLLRRVLGALDRTAEAAARIARGELDERVPEDGPEELGQIASAFNAVRDRLIELSTRQEEIVRARTRELEVTARMGHTMALETDLDRLLQTTIETIRDRLGYYHAQVFLLDDLRQFAVLRASMGPAGREMLARSHKLAVGSRSVVGQSAGRDEPVLASDTRHAEYWRPNPLLPDTRAELAVPLHLTGQVIGVLDIQAAEPDAFDEPTIAVLQALADQLSVAIRNAELFEEKEGLLSASMELTQMLTQDSWDGYLAQRRTPVEGFAYDLSEVKPLDDASPSTNGGKHLQMPIALRGAVIGELVAELDDGRALSDDEQQLVGDVLARVALAIDNARLVEQTQLSLQQTNRLYRATQVIAAANSIEEMAEEMVLAASSTAVSRVVLLMAEEAGRAASSQRVRMLSAWSADDVAPLPVSSGWVALGEHELLYGLDRVGKDPVVFRRDEQDADAGWQHAFQALRADEIGIFPLVPPIAGRGTLGWLVVHSRSAGVLSEEEVRFYDTVADQAATALEGLRLFEQTRARARRLQAANEVSRAASSALTLDALLPLIVDHIRDAFDYYHAQIFLVEDDWAVLRASTGPAGAQLLARGHRLEVGSRSVIGQVTVHGEPVVALDTDADPVHRHNELLPDTRAEMGIPLRIGDQVIGALDVQSTQPRAFDDEAQAILQSLGDQIAVTLANARLFDEIQERVGELSTINIVSQEVSRADSLDNLYEVIAAQLIGQFGAKDAFLGLFDPAGRLALPVVVEDGMRRSSASGAALAEVLGKHVAETRDVLLLNHDTAAALRGLGANGAGPAPRSLLAVPLTLGDEVIGVVALQDAAREHAYDEADVRQLTTLAAYAAVKIRNEELLDEAQRSASELGFLFNITRAAVSGDTLQTSLTAVSDLLLREIRGAEAAAFYLADADNGLFVPEAAAGYAADVLDQRIPLPPNRGLLGLATREAETVLVRDARDVLPRGAAGRTRSALAVPLVSADTVLGVLTIESQTAGAFGEDDRRLLEGAAGTLSAVIQSARLLEQITEANQQLRQLDQLKSQFLANMSHELRTPLNSIIGFSRVMLKGIDGPLNELQSQDLNTIYNSGQHLLGLINNILDLSKIEAGKMEIQPEYTGLGDIVESVISTGRGLVKDAPVQIRAEVEPTLPWVYADPVRVRQILLNLVSNAAKFTSEGEIVVSAFRVPADDTAGTRSQVQISVADSGIGIAEEDMNKLFEAFSQVDGSTTRQVGGTGLGLTISKEFVELMGGRIWVESTAGEGSTFSFTVPLHPADVEPTELVVEPDPGEYHAVVLAADDQPAVLDLYRRYLGKAGYALYGVNNANDLLDYVRELQPDVLLLDLNMPGKSGWAALDDLGRSPDVAHIPVVVCSIDEEDTSLSDAAGISAYLTKPVVEDDLLYVLDQLCGAAVAGPGEVLILDPDDRFAGELAAALQSTCGCAIRHGTTGLSGLEMIAERAPDVVIMALDLPDMDGMGLLMSMRSEEKMAGLPVLLLGGQQPDDGALTHVNPQLTRWLGKTPQDNGHLLDAVTAAVMELTV